MDSRYRFLTLGIPWTQSMPSRDVNAATRLAEASWRRDNYPNTALYQHPDWTGAVFYHNSLTEYNNIPDWTRTVF